MNKYLITLLALLAIPILNFAQDSYTILPDTVRLNEIIIQASKTGDNLQEIQAATTYIPEEEIQEQNLNALPDLSARVPNLFMPNYGARLSSPIYMRGIGARIDDPAVGLYLDDVPYFDKGSFNFEFFDIQKIEVLRGPQGTLYGRNTEAGLIKVYTPEPEFNSTGKFRVEYGNNNHIKMGFETNQKLSNTLALIVGGAYAHSDGFFTNLYSNTPADKFDIYNGRFKLLFKPSDNFSSTLSLNFQRINQNGYPYALYDTETQTIGDVNYNDVSTYESSLLSLGLKMEYRAQNFILSSASSYQYMKDYQGIDQDFTPASLFWVDQNRKDGTWVEELNIRSLPEAKLNWIVGLFGFHIGSQKDVGVTYGSDAIAAYHLPGPINYIKLYDRPTTGAAAYGQASYTMGKFKLTLGARIDYETSTLDYDYNKYLNGSTLIGNEVFTSKLQGTTFLPKASLSYNPTENITIFTTYASGYRAGGFNSTFEREEDRTFNAEHSTNYELGIKSVCMDNRLITNLNLFYIDLKGQQVYQPVPSGTGSMLANAGHSYSKGIEFSIRFLMNKNLTAWGSYGYTEAKFLDYQRYEDVNYGGNYFPYIPMHTLNLGANYTVFFKGNSIRNSTLSLNFQQFGKFYWNDSNTTYQDAYGLLNGRLNFHSRHFDFGLWGKNLLNAQYNAFYFEALGNSYAQAGKPIQYGVFLNFNI